MEDIPSMVTLSDQLHVPGEWERLTGPASEVGLHLKYGIYLLVDLTPKPGATKYILQSFGPPPE